MNRICQNCERELLTELQTTSGFNAVADLAGEPTPDLDEIDATTHIPQQQLTATVRVSCSCSSYNVELDGAVSVFAYLPDEWEYEDEADGGDTDGD